MEKKVIVSEKSPAAIGPYSQAIEYNGIVYTSGVIGVNPATGEERRAVLRQCCHRGEFLVHHLQSLRG